MKREMIGRIILCEGVKRYHIRGRSDLKTFCGRFNKEVFEGGGTSLVGYPEASSFKGEKPVCDQCARTLIITSRETIEEWGDLMARIPQALQTLANIVDFMPDILLVPERAKKVMTK